MALKYRSGDNILAGDRVLYHGAPGEIDFVVDPAAPDPSQSWYVQEFGSGVMITVPKVFGCVFISDLDEDEDLVFVSRRGGE